MGTPLPEMNILPPCVTHVRAAGPMSMKEHLEKTHRGPPFLGSWGGACWLPAMQDRGLDQSAHRVR